MKQRNIGIDFLKFFAALLITNSHMDMLYEKYSFLSTGGCIGDVLFFFCSGFTLFLKPLEGIKQFPDWYKRRVNRIYPTVLAIAVVSCVFFGVHLDIVDIILYGGGWFVSCIMLYYVALYFVGAYLNDRIFLVSTLVALGTAVWFYFVYQTPGFNLYGGHYIRWLLFFDFMLLGAKLGTMQEQIKIKPIQDFILLIVSIVAFYAIYIPTMWSPDYAIWQYFSFIPLMTTVYYFYKVSNGPLVVKMYNSKVGNFLIRVIGGLCLEIYLIQGYLFTDKMNHLFPLNIFITFIIVFIAAYLVRCLSRFISQTFKDTPYDWGKIVDLY